LPDPSFPGTRRSATSRHGTRRPGAARLIAGALLLAGFAAACSSGGGAPTLAAGTAGAVVPIPSVRQVHVSISDAGCAPQELQLSAGPATFVVTNSGSANVLEYEVNQSDRVLGEVENVIPGIDRTFTLNLKPGTYQLSCPGGTTSASGTLTVTE
jgi:iron uptake system EfeUOB component EfeO/EfeM